MGSFYLACGRSREYRNKGQGAESRSTDQVGRDDYSDTWGKRGGMRGLPCDMPTKKLGPPLWAMSLEQREKNRSEIFLGLLWNKVAKTS